MPIKTSRILNLTKLSLPVKILTFGFIVDVIFKFSEQYNILMLNRAIVKMFMNKMSMLSYLC